MKLYLIRHCEATGQLPEAPLTENGRAQALSLATYFENMDINSIYSSPYTRAIQSIEPTAKKLQLPIQTDIRLRERVLSEQPIDHWMEVLKKSFADGDFTLEGGESTRTAMNRIVQMIDEILLKGDDSTIIVTHGNLLSLLLRHLDDSFGFEQWKSLKTSDVFVLTYEDGETTYERLN